MFANKSSVITAVDGSMFSDFTIFEVENTDTTFSLRKLGRDLAAFAKLSGRTASVGVFFGANVSTEV